MNDQFQAKSVVAGIDGSEQAVMAAQWAVDEAVSRNVPLRLVSVMKAKHSSNDDYYADLRHAEASLRTAQAAVEATGKPVKVETAIREGLPGAALVAESHDAELVCVGSVGIGRYARSILGSTATELAEKAHCPVAVIRPPDEQPRHAVEWIIVADTGATQNQPIVEAAMQEARLREAPVLVVGKNDGLEDDVDEVRRRHPDLRVYPVGNGADVARFLKKNDERVQLAVIGSADAGKLAQILGPHGHPHFHHTQSSVLVVRGR